MSFGKSLYVFLIIISYNQIVKIYLSHSTKYDYKKEFYEPLKQSILNKIHDINYFLQDDSPAKVKNSKEIIKDCDLIIADITFQSTAIGIEIGWADAFNKKIILIYKKGSTVSKYMSLISEDIIEYADSSDLINKLEKIVW